MSDHDEKTKAHGVESLSTAGLAVALRQYDAAHEYYGDGVNLIASGCRSCGGSGYSDDRRGLHPNDSSRICNCVADARYRALRDLLQAARSTVAANVELSGPTAGLSPEGRARTQGYASKDAKC